MSVSCTWHFLVPQGCITGPRLAGIVEMLRGGTLKPLVGPEQAIWAMSADGYESVPFASIDSAIQWMVIEGGLVSFVGADDDDELMLSVHLIDGQLVTELSVVGDAQAFDEIRLHIDPRSAQSGRAAWRVFDQDAVALAARCGAVFAWCMDELSLEAVLGQVDTHQAISREKLPTFSANSIATPDDSPLAEQLRSRYKQPGTLLSHSGWSELRSESGLWPPELGGPTTQEAKPPS